jgi:hypothetical protein
MMRGLVPYRDLFEQKGPLLYAIHALASLFSSKNLYGVYILEAIVLTGDLILAFKISKLYVNEKASIIVAIVFPVFLLNENVFRFGDSAEEFSTIFLLFFIYLFFKHIKLKSNEMFSKNFFLLNGIMVACVFWIKFTLIGGWIGFYFSFLIICILKKRWKELLNGVLYSLFGIILSTLPWLFYFGIHSAIKDWLHVYLWFNLFLYPAQEPFIQRILPIIISIVQVFILNIEISIMIFIGVIGFFKKGFIIKNSQKWMFLSIVLSLIFFVYIGGRFYPYYFQIISPTSLFGLITVAYYLKNTKLKVKITPIFIILISVAVFFLTFCFNSNFKESKWFHKETSAQQKFAKIIKEEKHPTLLNYNSLDGGFYLAADILPTIPYFEMQNIDYHIYPDNLDEQHRYLKEKQVEFVVIRLMQNQTVEKVNDPYLKKNYHIVSKQNQLVEGVPFTFYLYKKN